MSARLLSEAEAFREIGKRTLDIPFYGINTGSRDLYDEGRITEKVREAIRARFYSRPVGAESGSLSDDYDYAVVCIWLADEAEDEAKALAPASVQKRPRTPKKRAK